MSGIMKPWHSAVAATRLHGLHTESIVGTTGCLTENPFHKDLQFGEMCQALLYSIQYEVWALIHHKKHY